MSRTRVLVVEDERIVALHLKQQLAKMDYQVVAHAVSGQDALRQIDVHRPDVVLMDINIEGPIDGIETASRIPPGSQALVIYLTVSDESATLSRAAVTKPYGYLLKPFSEREMNATIQMALARRAADIAVRDNEKRLERLVNARTAELETHLAERLVAEQTLLQAQKLEAIGQLTSGVAHDFNNLLHVVVGNLTLLEKRTSDHANAHLVTAALEAAQRGASLTRRLLTFGRQPGGKAENLDVNMALTFCNDLIGGTVGPLVQVHYQLQAKRAVGLLDREEFERVILNLAVNARHAMPDGGMLTIDTETVQVALAEADENLDPGDYVRIAMHDTGQGMSEDVMARAFDSFFTTKDASEGSGLGLSQAYGFATRAGGHAVLESVLGEGTSVILFLPLAAETG